MQPVTMVRRQAALGAAAVLLYANNADAFMVGAGRRVVALCDTLLERRRVCVFQCLAAACGGHVSARGTSHERVRAWPSLRNRMAHAAPVQCAAMRKKASAFSG